MKLIRIITVAAIAAAFITTSAFSADAASPVPKDYPLKTCVVSDETLGEHGKPVKVTHEGTDVWLCCKDCVKDFKKEPEKFVKMVKDAKAHPKK
jgi:YHS domain-containing protein